MEITLKKKENEQDELPEESKEVEISIEEKNRQLEIENAELRGFKKGSETKPATPATSPQSTHEQTKARVMADMAMDDEKFKEVYGMDKQSARIALSERETALTRAESKRAIAEAEAKMEMGVKYGAAFYQYKNQVDEALADLSDETKADPARLSKAMERLFLSFQKEGFAPKINKEDARKKMLSDFTPPTPAGEKTEKKNAEEIPEQFRPFSKVFGIRSEAERQDLMKTIEKGEFVPMNMGGGYWFKDPTVGFEHVEPAK